MKIVAGYLAVKGREHGALLHLWVMCQRQGTARNEEFARADDPPSSGT